MQSKTPKMRFRHFRNTLYILDRDPALCSDPEALREIAGAVSVDEIHLIDADGVIFCARCPNTSA